MLLKHQRYGTFRICSVKRYKTKTPFHRLLYRNELAIIKHIQQPSVFPYI